MRTTTARMTAVAAVLLWLCCTSDPALGAAGSRHDHVRTKSSLARPPRTDALTADMPAVTAVAAADGDGAAAASSASAESTGDGGTSADAGVFRNLLVRKPSKMLRKLMLTGVNVVQRGMDAYQSATSRVYQAARNTIGRPRAGANGPDAATSGEGGRGQPNGAADGGNSSSSDAARSAQRDLKASGRRPRTEGLGNTVIDLLDTGIGGIEQMTDLGLLLGNIGTHKVRAKLDGQSGNREILKLLVKYAGSRVGIGAKGSPVQMIDDVGIISTFVANDDEMTTMMSTMMERVMKDPEVSKALVRLAISVLDGNPSTQCVLDQLPLAPADLRMLFDVFVGSNGQMMMKTIAGLVADLTTGPDTKAFLESALGMVSMFKSSNSKSTDPENHENKTSFLGSLTGLFTGGDIDASKEELANKPVSSSSSPSPPPPPPPPRNVKKRPPPKKLSINKKEDPWLNGGFSDDKTVSKSAPKKSIEAEEDFWLTGDGDSFNTVPKTVSGGKTKPKSAAAVKNKPTKLNEIPEDRDINNLRGKQITKLSTDKPKNRNLIDDGGGIIENGNKMKRKPTRPTSKVKTNDQINNNGTDENFWFDEEKNEMLLSKKQKTEIAPTSSQQN